MNPPSFTQTWGCQMIAYMLNSVLYGMGLILVFQYFREFGAKDSKGTRITVFMLGIFGTTQYVFLSHQIYTDYVSRFGREDLMNVIIFSADTMLLAIYLTAFTAQMFFASRIWLVSKSRGRLSLLTIPVVLLSLLQIGAGIAQTVLIGRAGEYSSLGTTTRVTSTQAAATAACDIAITTILCYILNTSRSGIKRTDTMIDRLIIYAVNRGLATSICALLNLILFVSMPGTFVFMIWLLPSSQLYVISVCSMLLSRTGVKGSGMSSQFGHELPLSEVSNSSRNMQNSIGQGVHVQRDIVKWDDQMIRAETGSVTSTRDPIKVPVTVL
ncbi:hypothetical protein BDQ17DRAFT_1409257 [Cyathus striatus]|nr:hypothetical protein BDQ17DRAFT_1409257 [Cyathus striatus]